ncbi:NfeD family protein [Selenomonas sp.]|uniref:NfeD family protein n=1 Tax=Selenomonas sp. TaxID=2053611 RepID=UPI0025D7E0F0|nr:NfeD family protein [Selenomonas sp.]MCI6084949.1 serine protease [Selenomonas sp.]MDY3298907.1 NfeD family protein [Selenomonas sp.]
MAIVTLPVVKMLLVAIMFLGLLVEIKTGGMGAGVLLGIVAAGVFWGSQYVEGAVSFYMVAVFLGGILCIIIEMLLPTVGLFAGVGVAAMLYSVVLALGGDVDAILAMLGAVVLAVVTFALIVKKLPSSKLWNKFVLHDQSTSKRGFVSAAPREALVGRTGVVTTELRPSGTADIDGKPVDVVSEGAFLPKGTEVRVVTVEGARVVVRKS